MRIVIPSSIGQALSLVLSIVKDQRSGGEGSREPKNQPDDLIGRYNRDIPMELQHSQRIRRFASGGDPIADRSLVNKLKLKPGQRAAIIHAPEGYTAELQPLPQDVELVDSLQGQFDWVQVFVKNKAELEALVPHLLPALKPESLLWISFPKGSSKIQTDLTRDQGWESLQGADLKWINLISVNETWSAFSLRSYRPGEARQSFR